MRKSYSAFAPCQPIASNVQCYAAFVTGKAGPAAQTKTIDAWNSNASNNIDLERDVPILFA